MGFNHEVLVSEIKMMREKEVEMLNLYNGILKELEHARLHERLRAVRDDEQKHVGYCDILLSLFDKPPRDEGTGKNTAPDRKPREPAFR